MDEESTPPSPSLLDYLTDDALLVQVASYLEPRDLLALQCVSKRCHDTLTTTTTTIHSNNSNNALLWRNLCKWRWASWPRYRLTPAREREIMTSMASSTTTTTAATTTTPFSWQRAFLATEQEATRSTLRLEDLTNLQWYLSYVLSGIRGEGRSEHVRIRFTDQGFLLVPNYPPLPYEIVQEEDEEEDDEQQQPQQPQRPEARRLASNHNRVIRPSLRGDNSPFSERQWLRVMDFPIHYIARQKSTAEWLIVNPHVIMVSSGWAENQNNNNDNNPTVTTAAEAAAAAAAASNT